jgi:hypothetical protein
VGPRSVSDAELPLPEREERSGPLRLAGTPPRSP